MTRITQALARPDAASPRKRRTACSRAARARSPAPSPTSSAGRPWRCAYLRPARPSRSARRKLGDSRGRARSPGRPPRRCRCTRPTHGGGCRPRAGVSGEPSVAGPGRAIGRGDHVEPLGTGGVGAVAVDADLRGRPGSRPPARPRASTQGPQRSSPVGVAGQDDGRPQRQPVTRSKDTASIGLGKPLSVAVPVVARLAEPAAGTSEIWPR